MSSLGSPLSVTIDPGSAGGADRATQGMGGLMAGVLLLSAWEHWQDDPAGLYWLAPLAAALACAGWCLALLWRSRRSRSGPPRPRWSLAIAPDGQLRLVNPLTAASVDAEVAMAWGLGGLIYLRIGPIGKVACAPSDADVGQSAGCRWLLARRDFSEAYWHGLRRWLVWYRRSARAVSGPA